MISNSSTEGQKTRLLRSIEVLLIKIKSEASSRLAENLEIIDFSGGFTITHVYAIKTLLESAAIFQKAIQCFHNQDSALSLIRSDG